jgi:hypothetical protein
MLGMDYAIGRTAGTEVVIDDLVGMTDEQRLEMADKALPLHKPLQPVPPVPLASKMCRCLHPHCDECVTRFPSLRSSSPPPERRFECVYCKTFCPIPVGGTMFCGRRILGGEVKESKQ